MSAQDGGKRLQAASLSEEILAEGRKRLHTLEIEHNVEVLWAIESGSRAWGFASPDSDYDLRFIYRHNRDWYLSIQEQRDVIEKPLSELWDINGWDLRKTLRLGLKSNPTLHEWLMSPIVYTGNEAFHKEMRQIVKDCFCMKTMLHHYCNMAVTQLRRLQGSDEVKLKGYFYAFRPVLALQWIAREQDFPPIDLPTLRQGADIPAEVEATLDDLLARKLDSDETAFGPRHLEIESWVWSEYSKAEAQAKEMPDSSPELVRMDNFFREWARL